MVASFNTRDPRGGGGSGAAAAGGAERRVDGVRLAIGANEWMEARPPSPNPNSLHLDHRRQGMHTGH